MRGKLEFDLRRGRSVAGFIRIAPATVALAALALAVPAFAQSTGLLSSVPYTFAVDASRSSSGAADGSLPDASAPDAGDPGAAATGAPDSDYALPPPDDGLLADPSSSTDAAVVEDSTSADASPGDALTSAAPPIDLASPLGGIAPVAAADGGSSPSSHSGWDRVGDSETDDESDDLGSKVLEVPQAVPSPDASSGNGANQSAQGGDSAPPDEVGSVDDYQDEQDMSMMGVYVVPVPSGPPVLNPPFGVGTFGSIHAPANAPYQQNGVPTLRLGAGGIRPFAGGMNSAIMPTSPMFPRGMPMVQSRMPMVPRNSAPIQGGWWNRAR